MGEAVDLRLTLRMESPFYVGSGHRTGSSGYYGASLTYVPGRVLRAAFARAITDECPYIDAADAAGQRRWVTFEDGDACRSCRWRNWCRVFPDIGFGDATPGGSLPFPQTAVRCKYGDNHSPVDLLALWLRLDEERRRTGRLPDAPMVTCPTCEERVERAAGDHLAGQSVQVERMLLQHVGMDPATHSAAESLLFSIDAVAPQNSHGDPLELMARIRWPAAEKAGDWNLPGILDDGTTPLHVGARTSTGLGRAAARIEAEPITQAKPLRDRLVQFRRLVGGDTWYAPLLLTSDAVLSLERCSDSPGGTPDKVFLKALEDALGLDTVVNKGWRLTWALADHAWRGGWDTSKAGAQRYRTPQLHLLRGSVLVLERSEEVDDEALEALERLEEDGVGLRQSEGFGWIRVCDAFHIDQAVREVSG